MLVNNEPAPNQEVDLGDGEVSVHGVDAYIAGIAHAQDADDAGQAHGCPGPAAKPLAGWSVGHVITHIARNADSVLRRLEAASRAEVIDQYVGGAAGRLAEIEAGAHRPAGELLEDTARTNAAILDACARVSGEAWNGLTRGVNGRESPAYAVVFGRRREVEVHHVDIGLGYAARHWPELMVRLWLPEVLAQVPARADPRDVLAWALVRGPAPVLAPWG
jgi:maleylpyruvate isomerase